MIPGEQHVAFPQFYPENSVPRWSVVAAPAGYIALRAAAPDRVLDALSSGLNNTRDIADVAEIAEDKVLGVRDEALLRYDAVTVSQAVIRACRSGNIKFSSRPLPKSEKRVQFTPQMKGVLDAIDAGAANMGQIASMMMVDEVRVRLAYEGLLNMTGAGRSMPVAIRRLFESGRRKTSIESVGREVVAFRVHGHKYSPATDERDKILLANRSQGMTASESAPLAGLKEGGAKSRLKEFYPRFGALEPGGLICASIVLGHVPFEQDTADMERLSPLEAEVFYLLCTGNTNARIAQKLNRAQEAIKGQVKSILRKLKARDREHAVLRGFEAGLLTILPDLPNIDPEKEEL